MACSLLFRAVSLVVRTWILGGKKKVQPGTADLLILYCSIGSGRYRI